MLYLISSIAGALLFGLGVWFGVWIAAKKESIGVDKVDPFTADDEKEYFDNSKKLKEKIRVLEERIEHYTADDEKEYREEELEKSK